MSSSGKEIGRPVHKLSTFLPTVANLVYNKYMSNKVPNMITLELTIEEAQAYVASLDRALDNPFIQDDDECQNLWTLNAKLDASIEASLDPVV